MKTKQLFIVFLFVTIFAFTGTAQGGSWNAMYHAVQDAIDLELGANVEEVEAIDNLVYADYDGEGYFWAEVSTDGPGDWVALIDPLADGGDGEVVALIALDQCVTGGDTTEARGVADDGFYAYINARANCSTSGQSMIWTIDIDDLINEYSGVSTICGNNGGNHSIALETGTNYGNCGVYEFTDSNNYPDLTYMEETEDIAIVSFHGSGGASASDRYLAIAGLGRDEDDDITGYICRLPNTDTSMGCHRTFLRRPDGLAHTNSINDQWDIIPPEDIEDSDEGWAFFFEGPLALAYDFAASGYFTDPDPDLSFADDAMLADFVVGHWHEQFGQSNGDIAHRWMEYAGYDGHTVSSNKAVHEGGSTAPDHRQSATAYWMSGAVYSEIDVVVDFAPDGGVTCNNTNCDGEIRFGIVNDSSTTAELTFVYNYTASSDSYVGKWYKTGSIFSQGSVSGSGHLSGNLGFRASYLPNLSLVGLSFNINGGNWTLRTVSGFGTYQKFQILMKSKVQQSGQSVTFDNLHSYNSTTSDLYDAITSTASIESCFVGYDCSETHWALTCGGLGTLYTFFPDGTNYYNGDYHSFSGDLGGLLKATGVVHVSHETDGTGNNFTVLAAVPHGLLTAGYVLEELGTSCSDSTASGCSCTWSDTQHGTGSIDTDDPLSVLNYSDSTSHWYFGADDAPELGYYSN